MDAIKRVRELPRLHGTADAKQGSKIKCGGKDYFNADEAKDILDSLLQNKELETLVMDHNRNFGSLESCRALGKLVQTSTTLKHLSLYKVGMDVKGLKLIMEGILNNSQSVLEALHLGWNRQLVRDIINEDMDQATDRVVCVSLESWRALGELVRTSMTLKDLSLWAVGMQGEHLRLIVEGILDNSQSTLETLYLGANEYLGSGWIMCDDDTYVGEGAKQLTDLLLGNTRALATLHIGTIDFSASELKSIGNALASNTTLINLTLGSSGKMSYIGERSWFI